MIRGYSKPLKVSTPEGQRIRAFIRRWGDQVHIEVPYLDVVKKDDPPFARNGVIGFTIPQSKYKETIQALTKYIEDLFLKGMADEDTYTSLGAKPKPRRSYKSDSGGEAKNTSGKGSASSIPSRSRRNESPENTGGRDTESEVATSNDSSADESD